MVSDLIQFTYTLGKASAPYIKATVAFVITVAIVVYENWDKVEKLWQYEYIPDTRVLV
jgi:hypothetical protein